MLWSGMLCCVMLCSVVLCSVVLCSVMLCSLMCLSCSVLSCSVLFSSVMFVEGAGGRESQGSSGQLGVWRPRYAGWEWPGGLSLKSNDPSLSGGESFFLYDVFCMSSSSARDGSMSAPRWTTMTPGAPKMAPRSARDVPRWPQSAFLQPQDGAQTHLVGF